jgi:D-alanyl-D-alanine carboxypeptidase
MLQNNTPSKSEEPYMSGRREIKENSGVTETKSHWKAVLVAVLSLIILLVGGGLWAKWYFIDQSSPIVQEEPTVSPEVEETEPPEESDLPEETEPAEEEEEQEEETQPQEEAPSQTVVNTDEDPDAEWELMLVNRWNAVSENYSVDELVTLSNGYQVDARIYPDLQEMFDEMRAEGVYPVVASGYRTYQRQVEIMDEKIQGYVENEHYTLEEAVQEAMLWVAVPGTSEHETGLAVDINADGIHSAGYQVYQWLAEHAWEYGFILRYPKDKEDITAMDYEPWHYRYVGRDYAKLIYESGLCLEEYLGNTDQSEPITYTYSGATISDAAGSAD